MTRSRIDVQSVNADGRASWKTEPFRFRFGRDKNRFDCRIDIQEGNQFLEPRDREWSVLSARTHENGSHSFAGCARWRRRVLWILGARCETKDGKSCHQDLKKPHHSVRAFH